MKYSLNKAIFKNNRYPYKYILLFYEYGKDNLSTISIIFFQIFIDSLIRQKNYNGPIYNFGRKDKIIIIF